MNCITFPLIQNRQSTIHQPVERRLASMPLDEINALHSTRGDGFLASLENLFKQNKTVLIGEYHDRQQGHRYLFHNKDYLCNPLNDVVICCEDYPVGVTEDEILQVNRFPVITAAIRDGAKIVGMDTDVATRLGFRCRLLESQLVNPQLEYERPAKLQKLKTFASDLLIMYRAAVADLAKKKPWARYLWR